MAIVDVIYLDNFRGFTDTVVPIRQVNFLVGENSTGKTSLLGLLELIASDEFWFSQNFNVGTYVFGGFDDIVSAGADDKKEFKTIAQSINKEPPDNQQVIGRMTIPSCSILKIKELR